MISPEKRWWYIAFALVLLMPVYAEYEETIHEDIFLVRPDNQYLVETLTPRYLASEDLAFFACIEEDDTPVRLSVFCKDNNNFVDVYATRFGPENCFIGSVDLDDFPCYEVTLAADYVREGENHRVTRDIQINKITGVLQKVLDTQYQDGGWSSPLDTAYALFSLKTFEDVFDETIAKGLNYLKNTRHDVNKCWPAEKCQISTTAMITHLLTQADYEDELRIISDATIYLEKSMNYIESGETWTLTIQDFLANQNNTINTSCVFGYNSVNTTYNISKYYSNEITNTTLTPSYLSTINVVCTENVYVNLISSERGQLLHYEGDNMTYVIPGACWTFNNENVTCDIRTTALAMGTPISSERRQAATSYLASLLTSSILGTYFPDGDIMNLALFVHDADQSVFSSDSREDAVKYMLYKQTNTGAWNATGTYYNYSYYEPQEVERSNFSHVLNDTYTRNIIYSGYAIQMLLGQDFTREDEPVQDAERWLSLNEQAVSAELSEEDAIVEEIVASYEKNVTDILNDPKRNAMALYVLQQHTRPFIKTNPRVIVFDTHNLSLELVNPTTFTLEDLTYTLSPELQPYIDVERKEYLAPFSYRKIVLTQTSSDAPDVFGYLRIASGSDEYAKIPVMIASYPSLEINFPRELIVFGSSTVAPLNISKSAHNFSCTLNWETAGIDTLSSFTIEEEGLFNLPVQFTQAATEEKDYTGLLVCHAQTSTFTFPFTLRVNRFITRPLAVGPGALTLDNTILETSFYVKNLLDESIEVLVSLRDTNETRIDFSDYVLTLYPGETRNVSVIPILAPGENLSLVSSVVIKTFNIEERIPITVEIIHEPEEESTWLFVAGSIFGVGALTLMLYFGYTNRKKLLAWYISKFRKESTYKKMMKSVEDYEQKEIALAIKNMIQIMQMEGASDKDIRARLIQQGFTDEEIQVAVKTKTDEPATAPKK